MSQVLHEVTHADCVSLLFELTVIYFLFSICFKDLEFPAIVYGENQLSGRVQEAAFYPNVHNLNMLLFKYT